MKRNSIGTLSLMALSLLLTTTGAHAQSAERAYVPFAFNVGTAHMPAGNYQIERAEIDVHYIAVRNLKTGASALSLFRPDSPGHVSDKLVFRHVGDHYFLAEIWGTAGSTGMTLPDTKQERELVVASAPASSNVEIALK
jgi:hypothetical protein